MMELTTVEKILMKHSVVPLEKIAPGDFVTAHIDYAAVHEGVDARVFEMLFENPDDMLGVWAPEKVGAFMSHHFCTAHSDELAQNQKDMREWAQRLGIKVHDFGSGIAHILVMEKGYAYPGSLSLFGDSHANAYGAIGAMGVQAGNELLEVFLTGKLWFKVPETHRYCIEGQTPPGVYARDVIQYIIGKVGMDASVYKSIEFDGAYVHSLPVPLRFPFTLMSTEMGAKCCFIEPDEITLEYLKGRVNKPFAVVKSDPGARIEKTFEFDVSDIEPQVATPSSPGNTKDLKEAIGDTIDQVCIGTCTGGSIYDFREAAKILEGNQVKARTLIIPGTEEVTKMCAAEGLFKIFVDSGCSLFPAYCGTCQTFSAGHLAKGETQMHPGPRNWTGRTAEGSFAYLASPATCAATAIEGKVADPRKYL